MASATSLHFGFIKIEDSPSPEPSATPLDPPLARVEAPAPVDPKDPEGFLKRCSGYKKTRLRCSAVIGKKTQANTHPTYLPTCSAHRDQQSFAGWCQYKHADGDRCGRLFRWVPPYLELCPDHQGHPDTPCYFFNLPLELRHEIFRYLLPTKAIGSSTAALHDGLGDEFDAPIIAHCSVPPRPRPSHIHHYQVQPESTMSPSPGSIFPMPLLDLFLVNSQIYHEAKDLLYSIAVFTIDVRKDGTFMCGRRLLEPRRADGSSHFLADEADEAKERFLKAFDWAAVKNYSVDILLENWSSPHPHRQITTWDEEVEIYDIRDYVSVVVSGILAKSQNLCKLQVRLCLADFKWSEEQMMANTKLVVSPFERLRNVRQPHLAGVFFGRPYHNAMLSVQRPKHAVTSGLLTPPPICSVPPLPTYQPVLLPGTLIFDAYSAGWAHCISSNSSATVTKKPPIRAMFTEFKDFFSRLATYVPEITYLNGRHAFLHRARVAREQEDVECFRHLRNELIQYWYTYLEQEERKKTEMNVRLSRMLDVDIYPSHEWELPTSPIPRRPSSTSAQSPVLLNAATMAKEGIPMTGNPRYTQLPPAACRASLRHLTGQQRVAFSQAQAQAQAYAQARQRQANQRHTAVQTQQSPYSTQSPAWQPGPNFTQRFGRERVNQQPFPSRAAYYTDNITTANTTATIITNHNDDYEPIHEPYPPASASPYIAPTHIPLPIDFTTTTSSKDPSSTSPGPSSPKRRRVDSGFEEVDYSHGGNDGYGFATYEEGRGMSMSGVGMSDGMEVEASYVGKGKGRMGGLGVGVGVGLVCGSGE